MHPYNSGFALMIFFLIQQNENEEVSVIYINDLKKNTIFLTRKPANVYVIKDNVEAELELLIVILANIHQIP